MGWLSKITRLGKGKGKALHVIFPIGTNPIPRIDVNKIGTRGADSRSGTCFKIFEDISDCQA